MPFSQEKGKPPRTGEGLYPGQKPGGKTLSKEIGASRQAGQRCTREGREQGKKHLGTDLQPSTCLVKPRVRKVHCPWWTVRNVWLTTKKMCKKGPGYALPQRTQALRHPTQGKASTLTQDHIDVKEAAFSRRQPKQRTLGNERKRSSCGPEAWLS